MATYLNLKHGFPAVVEEGDRPRYARHELLGVYDDADALWRDYDRARDAAVERMERTGRPNQSGSTLTSRALDRR